MTMTYEVPSLDDYAPFVGEERVQQVRQKAKSLAHLHVAHVSSTYYGGEVSSVLSSLTMMMNEEGIKTGWRTIHGAPDFFSVTSKFENALRGVEINMTELKKEIYEKVVYENSLRNHLEHHNMVVVHDSPPLPLIRCYRKNGPWIWRSHLDLSTPNPACWDYLKEYILDYDLMAVSLDEYHQDLELPQVTIKPAIDPFTIKNRELTQEEIQDRLDNYDIPTDLPIITQISNFERRKNAEGAIEAFRLAQQQIDATLVLLGSVALDDPEGEEVYRSLRSHQDERIIILSHQDTALVNALQSKAACVLQLSNREAYGLAITEAMWKSAAVIGSDIMGIRHQIEDGVNGYLVDSPEQAAERIVELIEDPSRREEMGNAARQSILEDHLMIRLLEDWLDIFGSFETVYELDAPSKDQQAGVNQSP